jgi:hypothetical protein
MATAAPAAVDAKAAERQAWSRYKLACRRMRRRGTYETGEPHAWLKLQAELERIRETG